MYKVGLIGRYRAGISPSDGRLRWAGTHAELMARLPELERLQLNFSTQNLGELGVNDAPVSFDGYAWMWYTSVDGWATALASPEWHDVLSDAAEFLDLDFTMAMAATIEEHVVIDGPEGPFKVGYVCRFVDQIRADHAASHDAHNYWKRTHGGAFGVKVPGIGRYQQNHVTGSLTDQQPGFDGLSECWFPDRQAFDVTMASTEWDAMNRDAYNLFAIQEFHMAGFSAFVDEVRIV